MYILLDGYSAIYRVSDGTITTFAGGGQIRADGVPATSAYLAATTFGIAIGPDGDVYFADGGRVRKISNGIVSTVAGGGSNTGDNIPATEANLGGVGGIAFDGAGSLYLTAPPGVRKVSNGVINTIAGSYNSRVYGGDNGPATSASFDEPSGIAVDGNGNVYVADTGNNLVRVLVPNPPECIPSVSPLAVTAPSSGGTFAINVKTVRLAPGIFATIPAEAPSVSG